MTEEVAPGFRAFVARTFGDEGRAWLTSLPAVLDELAGAWQLTLGRELTGGLLSLVREATTVEGRAVVLKVGAPWPRALDELTALTRWSGVGAPGVIELSTEHRAVVLERILPGTHPDPGEPGAVASVLRRLHVDSPATIPELEEIVRRRLATAVRDRRLSADRGARALETAMELTSSASSQVLLHGDFDDRNLLVCERQGLVAIDPLPCAGDPAYDAAYWAHANGRSGRRERQRAIAAELGLDPGRVRRWGTVVAAHG